MQALFQEAEAIIGTITRKTWFDVANDNSIQQEQEKHFFLEFKCFMQGQATVKWPNGIIVQYVQTQTNLYPGQETPEHNSLSQIEGVP